MLRRGGLRVFVFVLVLFGAFFAPAARAEVYATGNNAVLVFGDGVDGDTAPYHVIAGELTLLDGPGTLTLDLVHRELFVSNYDGRILVFDLDADGDVAPKRQISGGATGLLRPLGMAVDPAANELWVADSDTNRISVFARDADGDVAPLRTVGGASTTLDAPIHLLLDKLHGELLVSTSGINADPATTEKTVTVFDLAAIASPGAHDVAPARRLIGAATLLNSPRGLAIELAADGLIVADYAGALRFYARTAANDTAPVKSIAGGNTHLNQPYGLVLRYDDELLVGCDGSPDSEVVGHALASNGNAVPIRVLAGASTELQFSTSVTTDRAKYCSEGHVVDGCLFRDNFEGGGLCYWSDELGGPGCA